jgi:hypothetical protein
VRYLSLGDKPERYGHGLTEERERERAPTAEKKRRVGRIGKKK